MHRRRCKCTFPCPAFFQANARQSSTGTLLLVPGQGSIRNFARSVLPGSPPVFRNDKIMPSDHLGTEGAARSQPAALPVPANPLRILLVEDHADTRLSMEILLRRAAYQVRSADTAQKALALAAAHKFDLVITDIGLPDLSGIDLMKQLQERHGLEGIATSGYGGKVELEGSGVEFLHHLIKPINIEELRALLAELQVSKRPHS
jgi:CheY-like chemotaxis protein